MVPTGLSPLQKLLCCLLRAQPSGRPARRRHMASDASNLPWRTPISPQRAFASRVPASSDCMIEMTENNTKASVGSVEERAYRSSRGWNFSINCVLFD